MQRGGQSSWPKSIELLHLVFYESFNRRHDNYSDRFLLEKEGDRSLAYRWPKLQLLEDYLPVILRLGFSLSEKACVALSFS